MRVESALTPQTTFDSANVESAKTIDKKEVAPSSDGGPTADEIRPHIPFAFGSTGTYSVSSLRAAVDYHAKFLTVAENNMEAVKHTSTIPKEILGRFNGLVG